MKLPKETNPPNKLHGRWYGDACGTAFALEVIGERWSLLVVRELMLGGRRFSQLRRSLPGISAKVLTERLDGLERAGVLAKAGDRGPGDPRLYELTPWGRQAEPMLQELGRWAARSPIHDPTMPLSAVSLMLSMRTMVDNDAAAKMEGRVGFDVGGERFVATLGGDGTLPIVRIDRLDDTDAVFFASSAPVIAGTFYSERCFSGFEGEGGLTITGDRAVAQAFSDLLELPPQTA